MQPLQHQLLREHWLHQRHWPLHQPQDGIETLFMLLVRRPQLLFAGDHTNAIDWNTLRKPFLDVSYHSGGYLAVCCRVQAISVSINQIITSWRNSLIVIDVKLSTWISSTSCSERNANKIFPKNSCEDRVPQRAIFIEDFVQNILLKVSRDAFKWFPCY